MQASPEPRQRKRGPNGRSVGVPALKRPDRQKDKKGLRPSPGNLLERTRDILAKVQGK